MIPNITKQTGEIFNKIHQAIAFPTISRLLVSVICILGGLLVNRYIIRLVNRNMENANRRHVFRKITHYSTTVLVLLILLFIWIQHLAFLTAIIGFVAAGLAIALKDVLMSLFGWIKILSTHPFGVGDRIQIQDIEGDIIDITPLHTVILELGNWVDATQSTGRIIYIPNQLIFQEPLYNSTLGFPYLWDEFGIIVSFESDLEIAEELMKKPAESEIGINYRRAREEIQQLGNRYAIRYENIKPRIYQDIKESGVKLTIRYLTRARGRREIRSRISHKVMDLMRESPEVELAYPTYRIYRRNEERNPNHDREID
ncbi:MAG: mechanosensitive ion channel family protein [bacterium]